MKVVSKGFEGAMMLGAKKIDRSKISVLPKTAKSLVSAGQRWLTIFDAFFVNCDRATRKNSTSYALLTGRMPTTDISCM